MALVKERVPHLHAVFYPTLFVIINTKNSHAYMCSLDAEKCFNSICHKSLFYKLTGVLPINHWLVLYNWYQSLNAKVRWKGQLSKTLTITGGICQGCILSPILFNVFINEMLLQLQSNSYGICIGPLHFNLLVYADDVTVYCANVHG